MKTYKANAFIHFAAFAAGMVAMYLLHLERINHSRFMDFAQYENGLPANCRAYTQAAIDGYRGQTYTAEQAFAGLERNCGMSGWLWSAGKQR